MVGRVCKHQKETGGDEAEEVNRKPHLAAAEVDTLLPAERLEGYSQRLAQAQVPCHPQNEM